MDNATSRGAGPVNPTLRGGKIVEEFSTEPPEDLEDEHLEDLLEGDLEPGNPEDDELDPELEDDDRDPEDEDSDGEFEDDERDLDPEDDPDDEDDDDSVAQIDDETVVALDDGTELSIGELKRNNLFQRDYSQKTEELRSMKAQYDADYEEVVKGAQATIAMRERVIVAAKQLLPPEPVRGDDPLAYIEEKERYDKQVQLINQLVHEQSQHQEQINTHEQKRVESERKEEGRMLRLKMPQLAEPKAFNNFWARAVTTMAEHYGFTAEQLNEAADHRMYMAMYDLVKYHSQNKSISSKRRGKNMEKGKNKNTRKQRGRPAVLRGGKSAPRGQRKNRAAARRARALRETGAFEAGVAALADHD